MSSSTAPTWVNFGEKFNPRIEYQLCGDDGSQRWPDSLLNSPNEQFSHNYDPFLMDSLVLMNIDLGALLRANQTPSA
jgi:hypothetical protein